MIGERKPQVLHDRFVAEFFSFVLVAPDRTDEHALVRLRVEHGLKEFFGEEVGSPGLEKRACFTVVTPERCPFFPVFVGVVCVDLQAQ